MLHGNLFKQTCKPSMSSIGSKETLNKCSRYHFKWFYLRSGENLNQTKINLACRLLLIKCINVSKICAIYRSLLVYLPQGHTQDKL